MQNPQTSQQTEIFFIMSLLFEILFTQDFY